VNRLEILDAAMSLDELKALRSNRLEALKADRTGQYSIRINMQWRICFDSSMPLTCRHHARAAASHGDTQCHSAQTFLRVLGIEVAFGRVKGEPGRASSG
jgi:hypothetical protein